MSRVCLFSSPFDKWKKLTKYFQLFPPTPFSCQSESEKWKRRIFINNGRTAWNLFIKMAKCWLAINVPILRDPKVAISSLRFLISTQCMLFCCYFQITGAHLFNIFARIDKLCGKFHPINIIKYSAVAKRMHISVLVCLVVRFDCSLFFSFLISTRLQTPLSSEFSLQFPYRICGGIRNRSE